MWHYDYVRVVKDSRLVLDRLVAYLPENLEVFLFDPQQFAVLTRDDRRVTRTVVEYRLAERRTHSQRTQCHRVLQP